MVKDQHATCNIQSLSSFEYFYLFENFGMKLPPFEKSFHSYVPYWSFYLLQEAVKTCENGP